MSRILVLYGTTEGQTAKIARALANTLHAEGHAVDVLAAAPRTPNLGDYAGVVVAASVHGGRYQRPVQQWVAAHADELRSMPTAFVSVSLGVLQKDAKVQQEVAAILDRFLLGTGWTPTWSRAWRERWSTAATTGSNAGSCAASPARRAEIPTSRKTTSCTRLEAGGDVRARVRPAPPGLAGAGPCCLTRLPGRLTENSVGNSWIGH